MIKFLPWWLQQCLIPVNTFPLEESSKTETFGHSSNHIFRSQKLPKYLSYEADIFFQDMEDFV